MTTRILKCPECREENVVDEAFLDLLTDTYVCAACGCVIDTRTQAFTWVLAPLSLIALIVVLL